MNDRGLMQTFVEAAQRAGAEVVACRSLDEAVAYIGERAGGALLLPSFPGAERTGLADLLQQAGCEVRTEDLRRHAPTAAAGLTGVDFAIADTGTLVLASTAEPVRLATTLPDRHFAILDPRRIVADLMTAAPLLRQLQTAPQHFVAFITGPSRTADIERVLTIGVHGPKELHILLLEGFADGPLEM